MLEIVVVLFALWIACIVATGRLFKASGRLPMLGYLVGFIFTWIGVIIGLILLRKGPPPPRQHGGIVAHDGGMARAMGINDPSEKDDD
jgi:hypothetical protein